ncbi:MAG: DNA polymerase I, partial [Acidobacterium ailaaui]|nr:DNA polymerase I [Pseudacidobacterium ailaaui]
MNLRLASDDDRARIERRKQAQARAAEPEVSAEEWAKIFATKLSDTERDRLRQIKAEFDAGRMRRLAEDKYTKTGRPKAFSKAEALRRWPELVERRRQETLRRMVEN